MTIPFTYATIGELSRGKIFYNGIVAIGVARLPTDSIGNFSLTLTNLVIGSSVQIETLSGESVTFRNVTSTSEDFTIPAYPTGNPKNYLLIKIRKGSASPYYQPYETQTTAVIGSQSIFISQIPDE